MRFPNRTRRDVALQVRVHPRVALLQRDAQLVGHGTVHLQLLRVLAERGLAHDRIPLVGLLEESLANLPRLDRRHGLELGLVSQ